MGFFTKKWTIGRIASGKFFELVRVKRAEERDAPWSRVALGRSPFPKPRPFFGRRIVAKRKRRGLVPTLRDAIKLTNPQYK
jgi:hypothetical protein